MKTFSATRQGTYIQVTIKEDKKSDTCFHCRDIRGALVWPSAHAPGYYCIFSQKEDVNPEGRSPLVLLTETEEKLPQNLFQRLAKDARRYACGQWYIDFAQKNQEFVQLFYNFCQFQRVPKIKLIKAPLAENFSLGVALVKEWSNALEIPQGTILRNQLKDMEMSDVDDKPEEKFYAVNALRFIIADLPWQAPSVFQGQQSPRADPKGWA